MRWESVRRREGRRRVWAEVRLEFEHGGERFGLEWRRKRRPAEVVAAAAAAAMVSDSGEAGACLIAKWDGIFIFLVENNWDEIGRTDRWSLESVRQTLLLSRKWDIASRFNGPAFPLYTVKNAARVRIPRTISFCKHFGQSFYVTIF
jgi:hypothetical protein